MSGIIAVYGLVVSVLIVGRCESRPLIGGRPKLIFLLPKVNPALDYSLFAGFVHLAAGLSCGMTGCAAGYAVGIVGDAVSRRCIRSKFIMFNEDLSAYELMSTSRRFLLLWS